MIKNFWCIVFILFTFLPGKASDSIIVKKNFIGPPVLVLPPPIDSVVHRKLLVTERLKSKVNEQADFSHRQNLILLNTLLLKTETAVEPDAGLIDTLDSMLAGYLRTKDHKSQALVYSTYGVYYGRYGQPEKAVYYFNEALKLKELIKDDEGAATVAGNLAAIYKLNKQYDLAIRYAEYKIASNLKQKRTAAAAWSCLDIAAMKFQQEKYKQAEYYILKKAFPLFQRTGNKWGRMRSFQNLADLYFHQSRYSEAKWFCIQSQITAKKLADNQGIISSLTGLGRVKNALGEFADALQDYKRAEQLALGNNLLVKLVEINSDLGDMYSQAGDYRAADKALDQYQLYREAWFNNNKL